MSTDSIDEVKRIAGDQVRAIIKYDDCGIDVVTMTDAARGGTDPEKKLPLLRRITNETFPSDPFGPLHLSVHAFSGTTVLHLPLGSQTGVVATLEPTASFETLGQLVATLSGSEGAAPIDRTE